MAGLWTALGYDDVAATCLHLLGTDALPVTIEGPPGTGKSWLGEGIGAMWEQAGGAVAIAQGDVLRGEAPFYPFGFAMSGLTAARRAVYANLSSITRAGEALIGTGGLVTLSVEALMKARRARRALPRQPLSTDEQRILGDLEKLAGKQPLLLVADNVHWWDIPSLLFLKQLLTSQLAGQYPFLADLRILLIRTTQSYQRLLHPTVYEVVVPADPMRTVVLPTVPRERFAAVLEGLGSGPVSRGTAETVFVLSGGHLALAQRCAARLAAGDVQTLLATADAESFLHRILVDRVQALGERGRQALEVLQTAAVLGLTFRRDELVCASGGSDAAIGQLLRDCRAETLLDVDAGVARFAHDLYRQHFLQYGPNDAVGIYERLSDCLRLLNPGDYEVRCLNAVKAEQWSLAETLGVQAALARQREGLDWQNMSEPVMAAISSQRPMIETFARALVEINAYRFAECLQILASIPIKLAPSLRAEADNLKAMCLLVTRSDHDRAEARAILESWSGMEDEEAELGFRLGQHLLFAYSMVSDKSAAIALERRWKRLLGSRVTFDPSAEDSLYILERCAGRFHLPDRAEIAVGDAVRHFGPRDGQHLVRRPMELYRALVNLGSNYLTNGKYPEVLENHRRISTLIADYVSGTFPRLDYPEMNALQAEFRLGLLEPGDAARRQLQILDVHRVDGDPYYPSNALAVYLALADQSGPALQILDDLAERLGRMQDPEPSQLYLIRSNRCAVQYTSTNADVSEEWDDLLLVLQRVPYAIAPMLIRRHQLLAQVIQAGEARSASAFDTCLIDRYRPESGPFWAQLMRGFRLPDVEWWR